MCWAQDRTIDSLKLALKNAKHDTTRCNILSKLAETAPDGEWPMFNDQLLKLSELKLKTIKRSDREYRFYQKYFAGALVNVGLINQQQGDNSKAKECYSKGLKIFEEIGDQSGMGYTLLNIGFVYKLEGDIPKAIEYYNKSLQIFEKIGDKRGIAVSLNNIAAIYKDQGDYLKALDYNFRGLKIQEEIGNKNGAALLLNNIGNIYNSQGDITKALEFYGKSLKIHEEVGDKRGIALSLINLGLIYKNQGDITRALDCFGKSLKIYEEFGDKRGVAVSLSYTGWVYFDQGDFHKSFDYFNKSLNIQEEIGDKSGIATSLNNIGNVYKNQGNFSKALEYFGKSLNIQENIGHKSEIANSLNNIGGVYIRQKNYAMALKYITQSMKVSKEIGSPDRIKNAANQLNAIYKATGNYKLALENYELYIKMRDSLNNIETQRATIKQQTKYQYEKEKAVADEKHAAEIKQQEEKAAAEKKRQNIVIASVSVVLLLVAVFSAILFNRFRITQKQKAVIELKEKETQLQKHIIEEKHKEITDSINYAERIQKSFLATQDHLNQHLSEYFVLFKPKDVVSGDFYWSATLNNGSFALATADSTGHGVPGAIMSLLNITSLEKAIETETSPDQILNSTRKTIIERLKKDGSPEGGKDGMDCSLCVFDFKNKKLFVANANNPVWIVRGPETVEVKGDKMPVGKHDKQDVPFTLKEYEIQKGDVVYTLTDGFPDQFGGEKGKKFMSKNLRELLANNAHLSMQEQKSLLEKTFKNWVGNLEQVDDVTVIGIRM